MQAFVSKLEGHATIKLSPAVLNELKTISPETYTGVFKLGSELEVWAEERVGKRCKGAVLKAIADQKKALAEVSDK